ncbi:MAG: AAA family ATPase [Actinobacteria bacterium]|nr:AAA family ATPase [Actinomycetota bacterium]
MRISRVKIKNYRQLKDVDISFDKKSKNDLYIIIGRNGTGKTNFLNAINWCLYGDEPNLSLNSHQLHILNINEQKNSKKDDTKTVFVNIWFEDEDNKYIVRRNSYYKISGENKIPSDMGDRLEVEIDFREENGNININTLEGENAQSFIERLIPKNIREFYFFDGERLDRYFKEAISQNVRHSIFILSRINLLESLANKIEIINKDFRNRASKYSPKIDEYRKALEDFIERRKENDRKIEECENQINIAKEEINKCGNELMNYPDVDKLEEKRNELLKSKSSKNDQLAKKQKTKNDLLFEYSKILYGWDAIKNTINIIKEKRKKGEIPPKIETDLLEETIDKNICVVCKRILDEESRKKVLDLFNSMKLSSDAIKELVKHENPLLLFERRIKKFEDEVKDIVGDICQYEGDLEEIEKGLEEIKKELSGFDVEKIKGLISKRDYYEKINDESNQDLGVYKERKKEHKEKIKIYENLISEELSKQEKARGIKKIIDFIKKMSSAIDETKNDIIKTTQKTISSETNKVFFDLIWKKDSFESVKISDKYNISLINSLGYECLGTISAAEREFLALSFTLALHKVSGFDAALLIDTPLARVDDINRRNFGNVFTNISENKQVILLFTPSEYSKDIRDILHNKISNIFEIKFSIDDNISEFKEA